MSPKRKKTGARKKRVAIFRTGKMKARLPCGKFLEDGITPCPVPFKTEKSRKTHHELKHSTPERYWFCINLNNTVVVIFRSSFLIECRRWNKEWSLVCTNHKASRPFPTTLFFDVNLESC